MNDDTIKLKEIPIIIQCLYHHF